MANKIIELIDGKKSWMDIVDELESRYKWSRVKAHKQLSKLQKKGLIIMQRRILPTSTKI